MQILQRDGVSEIATAMLADHGDGSHGINGIEPVMSRNQSHHLPENRWDEIIIFR